MKQTGILAACALAFSAGMGIAQDGSPYGTQTGAAVTGGFELEFNRIDGNSTLRLDGEIDLRHRGAGSGAVGLGFDLGTDATFDLSEGEQDAALYAAAVLDWGFGEVAIGMPRSIGDVLIDRPSIAGMQAVDDLSTVFFPPIANVLNKYADNRTYGLRYENAAGQLRYGASVLRVQDVDGLLIEGAGEYAMGQGALEGMVEYATEDGKANALIGFAQSAGQVDFGVYMARQRIGFDGTSFQASVDYRMTERFTFGGDFVRLDGDEKTDLLGASMEYGFGNRVYGQFGFARSDGGDNYWDASVGFEF